ncbi:class I adenylate-forming enzyme family protein [Streptomyces acidicola]|uniref:class I adenylate-forming enzyme family protein n=1 Tax=Streptomyces acidicola TaxID=2596892 RepID=UPI00382222B5
MSELTPIQEVLGRTWIDVFVEQTDRLPEQPMAYDGDRMVSYGELRRQVDELALALLADGVRPGECLAIWMNNCLDFVVAQWAVYRVGCTLLPLYSYYRVPELEHCLNNAGVTTLFTKSDFAGKVDARALLLGLLPELEQETAGNVSHARVPSLRRVITADDWQLPGTRTVQQLAAAEGRPHAGVLDTIQGRVAPTDVMNVMFTSGTTGKPKGGLSMHRNNIASVHCWSQAARLSPKDVILCHVPLFTNFGCLYASALAVFNGASMVITPYFDAAESLRLITAHKITYVPGSPEIFRGLLEAPEFPNADVSTVRGGHVAGSELEPDLMARIIDELAPEVMQGYGMSECGGISAFSSAADKREARLGTVGRPISTCKLEIRDPLSGEKMPAGKTGEIWYADALPGSCVGKGYHGDRALTQASITPDGWFRSGDLGRMDENGYVVFAGRIKNMITVGGFNVYPQEIQQFLTAQDGVAEAHVVGVRDHRLGTVPVAFLVPDGKTLDTAAIEARARTSLSSQKRPRAYWITPRSELPYTPSGKVETKELIHRAEERRAARTAEE